MRQVCITTLLCTPWLVCSAASGQQPAGLVSFTAANSVAAVKGEQHNDLLKSHWDHLFGSHTVVTLIPVGTRVLR